MKARTLAVVNQKGGCGKTTIAVNLAACLAAAGERVLLIDMDPQGHASTALGIDTDGLGPTMYNALTDNQNDVVPFSRILVEVDDNLWLAPSDIMLSAIEQQLSGKGGRENRLRNCLAEIISDYDYSIIDCPPGVGLLSVNALRVSRAILVPIDMSRLSLQGIQRLLETVEMVCSHTAHFITARVVANMLDTRTNLSRLILSKLDDEFGEILCNTRIRRSIKLADAAMQGMAITKHAPCSNSGADFEELAREIDSDPNLFDDPMEFPSRVLFSYFAPEAREIVVAGEFNNWLPMEQHRLSKREDGEWNAFIQLLPGKYEYKFIVDGQWQEDPSNPHQRTGQHGQRNSVLEVN